MDWPSVCRQLDRWTVVVISFFLLSVVEARIISSSAIAVALLHCCANTLFVCWLVAQIYLSSLYVN